MAASRRATTAKPTPITATTASSGRRWRRSSSGLARGRSAHSHGHALPDRAEVRVTRLDLLRQGVDVAEAPFVGRAEEDRRGAGGLEDIVRRLERGMDDVAAAQPHAGAIVGAERLDVVGSAPDILQYVGQ